MSEATPTPWHVGTSGDVYSGATGGILIATVSHNANGPNAPSSKPANGRLIVAAVNAYAGLRADVAVRAEAPPPEGTCPHCGSLLCCGDAQERESTREAERLRAGLARAALDVDNLATRIGLQDLGSPWPGELGRIAQAAAALLEPAAAEGESPT